MKQYKNNKHQYEKFKNLKFDDGTKEAARFIFINKTSFNGIYRVNSNGQYNVPYGNNPYKQIVDPENLLNASNLLSKSQLFVEDFLKSIERVQAKDLVILDPPYTTAHKNNGFIEYNKKLFTWEDQQKLSNYVAQLIKKKAFYILMNAYHHKILKTYNGLGKRIIVSRKITVGGKYAKRNTIQEYIFTNTI